MPSSAAQNILPTTSLSATIVLVPTVAFLDLLKTKATPPSLATLPFKVIDGLAPASDTWTFPVYPPELAEVGEPNTDTPVVLIVSRKVSLKYSELVPKSILLSVTGASTPSVNLIWFSLSA